MKTITVRIKNVYGEDQVYPVCDDSILFANIAGPTTLTDRTNATIKQLGFSIMVEQQTILDRRMKNTYHNATTIRNLLHLLDSLEKAANKKSWVDVAFATSALRDILELSLIHI